MQNGPATYLSRVVLRLFQVNKIVGQGRAIVRTYGSPQIDTGTGS